MSESASPGFFGRLSSILAKCFPNTFGPEAQKKKDLKELTQLYGAFKNAETMINDPEHKRTAQPGEHQARIGVLLKPKF
ncbi:MAG: hypothetical protein JSR97_02890 [Verrucomicrobia bacterium]|nr:hypothetical protein [Verrucomicrobiota bacterium]